MGFIIIKIRQIIVQLVSSVCLWLLGLQHARFPWSSLNPTIIGRFFTIWATRKAPLRQVAIKSLQSCPTLRDPIDVTPPGSPVPGILQARKLEWVAISFSNAWKWKSESEVAQSVRLLVTPWTAAHQAPPSMGFSRQEYWSGAAMKWTDKLKKKKCKSLVMK